MLSSGFAASLSGFARFLAALPQLLVAFRDFRQQPLNPEWSPEHFTPPCVVFQLLPVAHRLT